MANPKLMANVGIVGAGVMGRLMALHLADAGFAVTLFDEGDRSGRGACSWVAGGMLAPFSELEKAEPLISQLGTRSLPLWRALLPSLPAPVFFQATGSLVVAHRQDMADLAAFSTTVQARLEDPAELEAVDRHRLGELEPELADRFDRGVYFPNEAQLEARDVLAALALALDAREVAWRASTPVLDLGPGEIVLAAERLSFDWVVDTRGLGARADLPLRGVRGEVMRFHAPEVKLNRMVRLMHPRYPLYIVPRPNDTYLIGATSIESDFLGPITVRSALELLSAVYSLHPGFAEATVLEQSTQCRPALDDNLPLIQMEPGLIRINGLYRHGYLISPALAEEAMARLLGHTSRFPQLSEVTPHAGILR